MSGNNKTVRWLLITVLIAVLAVLVWRLAPEDLFVVSVAAAVVVALLLATVILRWGARSSPVAPPPKPASAQDEMASDPGLEAEDYQNAQERIDNSRESKPRLPATEVVARYLEMAARAKAAEDAPFSAPVAEQAPLPAAPGAAEQAAQLSPAPESQTQLQPTATLAELASADSPPLPLIIDQSVLSEDDKIQLENAVWYRCENPFCKYTHFLEVHHIMDEKDGGNNKLTNLIVLCPFCHDLAHKGEIPEKEMRDWIAQRDERFNAKLNWQY